MTTRLIAIVFFVNLSAQAGAPSTISLAGPSSAIFGSVVTLTAAVDPPGATGKITFYEGINLLGTAAVTSGTAAVHAKLLTSGIQVLTARYTGDANYSPSLSPPVSVTISSARSTAYSDPLLAVPGASVVLLGDFNGDGIDDLILVGVPGSGGSVAISLGTAHGTFGIPTYFAASGDFVAGDFNLDGKLDLLAGTQMFLGNGDGTFRTPINSGGSGSQIIVADFNGDGIPDIAGFALGGGIAIFLGNGDGTFSSGSIFGAGNVTARYLTCGDFNGDGRPDLALTRGYPFGISIFLGNGDGTFTTGANLSSIYDPNYISTGDFNGDGKTDLVATNSYGGYATVFLSNGDGTFLPPMSFDPGGTQPGQFVVADLDGDGNLDLAIVNNDAPLEGNIGVLYGNGDGTFQPPVTLGGENEYYTGILIGDFNGDGRADLAISGSPGVEIAAGVSAAALRVTLIPSGPGAYGVTIGNASAGTPTSGPLVASFVWGTESGGSGWTCSSGACFRSDVLSPGSRFPAISLTAFSLSGVLQSYAEVVVSVDSLMSATGRVVSAVSPCSLSLSPSTAMIGAAGGMGSVNVTVLSLCSNFSFMTNNAWLTPPYGIGVYGGYPGTYTINYWVESNQNAQARTGTISFGGAIFTVNQEGAQATEPVSMNPSSGSLGRQSFRFAAQDTLGASNVQYVQFLFTKSGLSALNACYISYDPAANVFYLLNDDATQWYGLAGGTSNTIGNAQCEIHGATSGSSKSGTTLTVTADLSFRSGFAGPKTVYEFSANTLGDTSGWIPMGSWNDTGDANVVEIAGVNPLPGSGLVQELTATIADGAGGNTISFAQLVMNSTLNGMNACFIHYDHASNAFFLLNDAGTAWFGLLAGSAAQVSNSQCTLQGTGSGGAVSGSQLRIRYALSFAPGFAGTQQVYMQAADAAGNVEVWHNEGTDNP